MLTRVISSPDEAKIKALAARFQAQGIAVREVAFRSKLDGLSDACSIAIDGEPALQAVIDEILRQVDDPDLDVMTCEVIQGPGGAPDDWYEPEEEFLFPVVLTAGMAVEVGARLAFLNAVSALAEAIEAAVDEVYPADGKPEHRSRTFSAILHVAADDADDAVEQVRRQAESLTMAEWVRVDAAE